MLCLLQNAVTLGRHRCKNPRHAQAQHHWSSYAGTGPQTQATLTLNRSCHTSLMPGIPLTCLTHTPDTPQTSRMPDTPLTPDTPLICLTHAPVVPIAATAEPNACRVQWPVRCPVAAVLFSRLAFMNDEGVLQPRPGAGQALVACHWWCRWSWPLVRVTVIQLVQLMRHKGRIWCTVQCMQGQTYMSHTCLTASPCVHVRCHLVWVARSEEWHGLLLKDLPACFER